MRLSRFNGPIYDGALSAGAIAKKRNRALEDWFALSRRRIKRRRYMSGLFGRVSAALSYDTASSVKGTILCSPYLRILNCGNPFGALDFAVLVFKVAFTVVDDSPTDSKAVRKPFWI